MSSTSSDYSGHYILLTSYDRSTDEFTYMDPALSSLTLDCTHTIPSDRFSMAWDSIGTDNDAILCSFTLSAL